MAMNEDEELKKAKCGFGKTKKRARKDNLRSCV